MKCCHNDWNLDEHSYSKWYYLQLVNFWCQMFLQGTTKHIRLNFSIGDIIRAVYNQYWSRRIRTIEVTLN